MTRFTTDNLRIEDTNLMYMPDGYNTPYTDRHVVARFCGADTSVYQPGCIWQLDHTGYEDFADFKQMIEDQKTKMGNV